MRDKRVLRGRVHTYQFDGAVHLVVDDGNLNHGWKITRFEIAPYDVTNAGAGGWDCVGALATHAEALEGPVSTVIAWDWEDRRQVAWSSCLMSGDTGIYHTGRGGVIDPQHVVIRDLYLGISAFSATSTIYFNYFIELERVTLTDDQTILALIQEESQDVN